MPSKIKVAENKVNNLTSTINTSNNNPYPNIGDG